MRKFLKQIWKKLGLWRKSSSIKNPGWDGIWKEKEIMYSTIEFSLTLLLELWLSKKLTCSSLTILLQPLGQKEFGVRIFLLLNQLWFGDFCATNYPLTKLSWQEVSIWCLDALYAKTIMKPIFISSSHANMLMLYGNGSINSVKLGAKLQLWRIFVKLSN